MLVTSLIAIEVRVLFVLQQNLHITTTCSTSDNSSNQDVIVNPFFRPDQIRVENEQRTINQSQEFVSPEIHETSISLQITRPKMLPSSQGSHSDSSLSTSQKEITNHYVNSKEVRELKKMIFRNHNLLSQTQTPMMASVECPLGAISYCNPMFSETDLVSQESSNN